MEWGVELVTVGREREAKTRMGRSKAHGRTGKPSEVKPIFGKVFTLLLQFDV